jgi:hypothetical protein
MIKAGLRARKQAREQNEKIAMIVDAQLRNEQRFCRTHHRSDKVVTSQEHTDRRLDALIDIVRTKLDGKSAA